MSSGAKHPQKSCHPERSEGSAFAFALAFAGSDPYPRTYRIEEESTEETGHRRELPL
jgi:hypothetical protein